MLKGTWQPGCFDYTSCFRVEGMKFWLDRDRAAVKVIRIISSRYDT